MAVTAGLSRLLCHPRVPAHQHVSSLSSFPFLLAPPWAEKPVHVSGAYHRDRRVTDSDRFRAEGSRCKMPCVTLTPCVTHWTPSTSQMEATRYFLVWLPAPNVPNGVRMALCRCVFYDCDVCPIVRILNVPRQFRSVYNSMVSLNSSWRSIILLFQRMRRRHLSVEVV